MNKSNTPPEIIQLGNPTLRKSARKVTNIRDPKIQSLIDDLLKLVTEVNGVGIAAPQIGKSYRIFIVASHPNPRYPHAPFMEPTPVINPHIVAHSEMMKEDWEGCLSIPGLRGRIPRYTHVTVSYTDRMGNVVEKEFTDFIARIFQHEYDHLDGILFTDRVASNKHLITDKEYFKILESGTS